MWTPSLEPIPPPAGAAPRWTNVELPAYRHVPGLSPHPVNHPDGHSYRPPGSPEPHGDPAIERLPDGWATCVSYLFGIDLFNHRYFWEAHEAWEEVWHAVGHRTVPGHFVQGLIQISAAHLKRHVGNSRGVAKLLRAAGSHLDFVAGAEAEPYMGIHLPEWRARVAAHLDGSGDFAILDPRAGGLRPPGPGTAAQ